mmetsp:Transcript_96729/g.153058  ORF Transcript_96729/g.153058 Transcript_96729/m.153058 type:complete len:216 (-) Transcript_96729:3038-3685(-)
MISFWHCKATVRVHEGSAFAGGSQISNAPKCSVMRAPSLTGSGCPSAFKQRSKASDCPVGSASASRIFNVAIVSPFFILISYFKSNSLSMYTTTFISESPLGSYGGAGASCVCWSTSASFASKVATAFGFNCAEPSSEDIDEDKANAAASIIRIFRPNDGSTGVHEAKLTFISASDFKPRSHTACSVNCLPFSCIKSGTFNAGLAFILARHSSLS